MLKRTARRTLPFLAELPKDGGDPSAGRMGWIHPPVTLEVEGFMQYDYINHFIATVAGDFVVSGDITWDAIGAASGCGFVLRSDGKEAALNQYLTIMTRVASGHVLFATMAEGEVVTGQDIYAQGHDPNFNWQNEATNRLTVVGRGNRFWIYTNGNLIGEIDPSAPPLQPNLPPEPKPPHIDSEAMANYLQQQAEYDTTVNRSRQISRPPASLQMPIPLRRDSRPVALTIRSQDVCNSITPGCVMIDRVTPRDKGPPSIPPIGALRSEVRLALGVALTATFHARIA